MKVIKVINSRWPANVNFMIVHKSAATAPVKLNDTKLHQDPPGISGNLLEGRQYYDLFVPPMEPTRATARMLWFILRQLPVRARL